MPTKRIINQNDIDELATYILRKAKYNANINKIIKPFKEELKELMMVNSDYEWFSGKKKAVKLQKVSAPYVDLEKLKASTKDYKKYVSYRTQYRLTATDNKLGIKEVA